MPPGETTTGPPDFVGVGTQRSGTTWWFETLLDHPQIRGPRTGRKEQHFFDQFATRELTDERIARYHKQFPRGPGQIAGEWTPRYMHDFWVPPLIRRAAPAAKLLIMFRDPIERYRSGVPHRASRSADPRMEAVCADAAERGRYATQLKRVLAVPRPRADPDPPVRALRRRAGEPSTGARWRSSASTPTTATRRSTRRAGRPRPRRSTSCGRT